jgi:hypothetical protein
LSAEELSRISATEDEDGSEPHHHARHYFSPDQGANPFSGGATTVTTHYGEDETRL